MTASAISSSAIRSSRPQRRLRSWRIDHERLEATYQTARIRLDAGENLPAGAKATAAMLLAGAEDAIAAGRRFAAWGFLQQLERELVYGLPDEEIRVRLDSAASEAAQKLKNWRADAAARVSGAGGAPREERVERLREILRHLHEASQNEYFNVERLRRRSTVVAGFLACTTVGLLALADFVAREIAIVGPNAFRLAMLAGVLGGILSVARTLAVSNPSSRIPVLTASLPLTFTRPLFGPVVAFALLVLMHQDFIDFGENAAAALAAMSFAGGFSERWFLGLVEGVRASNGGKGA